MLQEVVYSEEIHPTVKQYLKDHGGKIETEVQTSAASPPVVLYKVIFEYEKCLSIGGDATPIYRYTLVDGGTLLVQFLCGYGAVPGHPDQYWTAIYVIRKDDDDGKDAARTEAR